MKSCLEKAIRDFDPELSVENSPTPPADWYTSPELFYWEKKSVFSDGWQIIGRQDQISNPGDFLEGCFLSMPYLVYRNESGQLQGFHNVCPHHGGWLQPDPAQKEHLICSYHGWRFDSNGRLLKAPYAGGSAALKKEKPALRPLRIQTWGPFILISFGDNPIAFEGKTHEEELGTLGWESLKYLKTISYSLECNWKVFVDNYLDGGYHVSVLHPDLAGNLDLNSYQNILYENSSVQRCRGRSLGDQPNRVGGDAYYGWFYPNTMVNRYGKWLDLNRVIPTSEKTCDVIFDYFYEGDADEEALQEDLRDSDQVQREDILISERVQKSMESGFFQTGFYAPKFEEPMYHFHRLLHSSFRRAL